MCASRWLPWIQKSLRVLILLTCAVGGVALIMYTSSKIYETLVVPMPDMPILRIIVGIVIALLSLVALVPLPSRLVTTKHIVFSDDLGKDVVHLTPLERTLTKEVAALPEVKRAEVFLSPTSDGRGVDVRAEVILRKAPQISSSAVRARLKNVLLELARDLLGTEEVSHVELEVLDISVERDLAMDFSAGAESEAPRQGAVPQTAQDSGDYEEPGRVGVLEPVDLSSTPESDTDTKTLEHLPGSPLPPFSTDEEDNEDKEDRA